LTSSVPCLTSARTPSTLGLCALATGAAMSNAALSAARGVLFMPILLIDLVCSIANQDSGTRRLLPTPE
jgi:hypothetical protein